MNAFDTFTLSPGGGGSVLRGTAPRAWAMLLGLAVSLGIVRCCFYLEPVRLPGPTVFRFLKWRTNHLRPPCGAHPPAGAASPSAARDSASEAPREGTFRHARFRVDAVLRRCWCPGEERYSTELCALLFP